MKKIFVYIVFIFISIVIGYYIYLPKQVTISSAGILKSPYFGILRNIHDSHVFVQLGLIAPYKNNAIHSNYKLETINYDGSYFSLVSTFSQTILNARIIEFHNDSSLVYVSQQYPKSLNPIKVFSNYFKAVQEKKRQEEFIDSFDIYMNNLNFLYGIVPQFDTVFHTEFITDVKEFKTKPTTTEIYQLIQPLEQFIIKNNMHITTPPMLNLHPTDHQTYYVQIAFGVDSLKNKVGKFKTKKMIKGNLLTATVKGGYEAVDKGLQAIENYIRDYKTSAPAIHFQYLITNRLEQPDSTQWITKINYPIY